MKKIFHKLLLLVIYFLLIFLPMFPGLASPHLWFFYPVLSALLGATPFLWGTKEAKWVGAAAIFPLFWYLLMLLMGELSFPERTITPLVLIILVEVVRRIVGTEKQLSIRLAYCVAALCPVVQHLIILTRIDYYYEGAVEEMGSVAYAETITGYGKPGFLILLAVLTLVAAYLGTLLSEKIFKSKVTIQD